MSGNDYLVRATAYGGRVRAFALNATGVVDALRQRHDTSRPATAALGRVAMGALLLAAASLKEEEQILTLEVRGGGPIGLILCTANGRGEVRGFVSRPSASAGSTEDGKFNIGGLVGTAGYLSVTKDLGMREPYQGITELLSGEIGDDLAYYLVQSEQTPSGVGLGVFVLPSGEVEAAGGYLVQLFPGLTEEEIAAIEREIEALPHPTTLLRQGTAPEGILDRIFPAGYEELDRYGIRFDCPCSQERFESSLVLLGREELGRIVAEETNDVTEVVCHFCNEAYHFSQEQLRDLMHAAD